MRYEDGMSASYPIRPIDDSEWEGFARVSESAFNSPWPREEMMRFDRMVVEPERTLVAFDGDQDGRHHSGLLVRHDRARR